MNFNKEGYPCAWDENEEDEYDSERRESERRDEDDSERRDEPPQTHQDWDESEDLKRLKNVLLDFRSIVVEHREAKIDNFLLMVSLKSLLAEAAEPFREDLTSQATMQELFPGNDPEEWILKCMKFMETLLVVAKFKNLK